MIRVKLYQNKNKKIAEAYGKWYPRPVVEETIGLDELAAHMASHNTPFSKGAIKGILTDAVVCTKELLLQGINVKFPDLAIFSIGLKLKKGGGAPTKEDFSVAKYIEGLKLRARATGELTTANLDTSIRRVDADAKTANDGGGSGSSSGGSSNPGSGSQTGGGGNADQGSGSTTPGGGGSSTPGGSDSAGGEGED